METEIQAFYKNKTIFLTGASGFLGKVIIEKLLRTTDVERIFVLIRPKRGKKIQERIAEWITDPLFEMVLKAKPIALERVLPIAGDCLEPDLGISDSDCQLLIANVQVVVHSAATVRFNEPLSQALTINTRATRLMIQLAKQMRRLEAFVHVSTAFSNCVLKDIDEMYYPENLSCSAAKVLQMHEELSSDLINNMSPALVGQYPNTYTYTKALAEQIVQLESRDLPACVFRPSIITSTYKEPVSGWIDNFYGPMSIFYGAATGVLRIIRVNVAVNANVVPVDFCVNMLLASAWRTASETKIEKEGERETEKANGKVQKDKLIYNYAPSAQNLLTWGDFKQNMGLLRESYPFTKMLWYPFVITTTSPELYKLLCFFYHVLPGYAIDLLLRLRGKQPRMVQIYERIHKTSDVLTPFVNSSWHWRNRNTEQLWKCMSLKDQQLFAFNMKQLNWSEYLINALVGMRLYLAKEEPGAESIERAKKILARFEKLHRGLQLILCSGGAAILWMLLKRVINF